MVFVNIKHVKNNLLDLGIDIAELDIDFSTDLTVEEYNRISEAILEEETRKMEKGDAEGRRVYSGEILYYDVETNLPEGDNATPIQIEDTLDAVRAEGLDEDMRNELGVRKSSASTFYKAIAGEFIDYAFGELSPKRVRKLGFAVEAFENENMDIDEAVRWFEEKDTLSFDSFNQNLFKDSTDLGLGKDEKIYDQTIQHYWDDLKERDIDDRDMVGRAALLDITKTLEGLAQNKEDPEQFNEQVQSFQNFFHKFRPEEYEDRLEDGVGYTLHTLWSKYKMSIMSDKLNTCLTRYEEFDPDDLFEENIYKEASMMHKNDPFTFVQAIGKEDALVGYTRSFLMRDSDDDVFLGVDTVEPHGVNGVDMKDIWEDMEKREDIVSAGFLGAIRLGDMLDVDYVAGKDARVNFGPRQAYGNTSRDIEYQKLGDTVPYYSVAETEIELEASEDIYDRFSKDRVEEVEKIDEEKSLYRIQCKKPGFAVYHESGEQEVRGFQTEPGWHETEAKILMEFP